MPAPPITPSEQASFHEDKRPALIGSLVAFLVINNTSVAARWWTQWRTSRKFFVDDYAILLACLCVNVVLGHLLAATTNGLGLHTWRINAQDAHMPSQLATIFMHVWVTMVFTGVTFTSIKISLLYFYKRLFLVHQRWLRLAWWGNLIYVVLWFFGSTGFYLFQCWPPEWYWKQYYKKYHEPIATGIKNGQCRAQTVIHVALPLIFGLASDIAILLLPMFALYSLQMGKRKKLAMILLFAVGTLACTLELVRIIELWVATDDHADPAWGDVNFLILSGAEEVTAVMCACLPVVAPQFIKEARQFRKSRGARVGSSRYGPYSNSRSRSRGFKRFGVDDKTAPNDASSGTESNPHRESIPMTTVTKAHLPKKPSSDSHEDDEVLVRTDVEVTKEQHAGRMKDPFALPPLD